MYRKTKEVAFAVCLLTVVLLFFFFYCPSSSISFLLLIYIFDAIAVVTYIQVYTDTYHLRLPEHVFILARTHTHTFGNICIVHIAQPRPLCMARADTSLITTNTIQPVDHESSDNTILISIYLFFFFFFFFLFSTSRARLPQRMRSLYIAYIPFVIVFLVRFFVKRINMNISVLYRNRDV